MAGFTQDEFRSLVYRVSAHSGMLPHDDIRYKMLDTLKEFGRFAIEALERTEKGCSCVYSEIAGHRKCFRCRAAELAERYRVGP